VDRVRNLDALETASVDLIVSNSVLEHVADPADCFRQCHRVLAPGGAMLHRVDYRDHFFKYPFHFLTFSQTTWDNFLSPGDLPRHRLDDHLAALSRAGFTAEVLEREADPEGLAAVAPFLAPEFASRDPGVLATTTASIVCRKSA
jgi:SAM-dependent methyltransferase